MSQVSPVVVPRAVAARVEVGTPAADALTPFLTLYRANFAFVWRTVRQLGVAPEAVDDVVQEIFVVVHRRHADFEGRSSVRTWLCGIARRIVADHRKSRRRKHADPTDASSLDRLAARERTFERIEAFDLVCVLLDTLDEAKREVFVLAELEGMTLAEIAEAARLRAARAAFASALREHEAREEGTCR